MTNWADGLRPAALDSAGEAAVALLHWAVPPPARCGRVRVSRKDRLRRCHTQRVHVTEQGQDLCPMGAHPVRQFGVEIARRMSAPDPFPFRLDRDPTGSELE
jgi:hypothetical protein